MKITLEFYECEHGGDLNGYSSDIRQSGGKIIDSDVNCDSEIGTVTFEVDDKKEFFEKFKETESYGFIN